MRCYPPFPHKISVGEGQLTQPVKIRPRVSEQVSSENFSSHTKNQEDLKLHEKKIRDANIVMTVRII